MCCSGRIGSSRNYKIDKYIQRKLKVISNKAEIDTEWVLKRYKLLADYSIDEFFYDDGTMKPFSEIPKDALYAIGGFKQSKKTITNKDKIIITDRIKEFKLPSKRMVLDSIGKHLGMEADEVLRLCQITGLSELFSSQDFSKSWDVEGFITQEELNLISEDEETFEEEVLKTKTVNTENRVFHTYDKWECFEAGFYATKVEGMNKEECQTRFRDFFRNLPLFEKNLDFIITNWRYSCEHYLSNPAMNRIAWLGQAAVCLSEGIPSSFRSGWSLLTEQEQDAANNLALVYLNRWLVAQGGAEVSLGEAAASGRQSVIY